jgi:hypothetical protein
VHAGLVVLAPAAAHVGFRADLIAQVLPESEAIPTCAPGGDCSEVTIVPDQLHAAIASADWHPLGAGSRWTVTGGYGGYLAREADGGWTARGGVSVGTGFAVRESGVLRLEVRYHHLASPIGELRGVVLPSLLVRF